MKRSEAKVLVALDAPGNQTWEIIRSAGGVDKWFPSVIKTCRVEGKKRYCETIEGIPLVEEILEVDNDRKIFRFAIPKQDMLPVSNVIEEMKVYLDDKTGKAIVEWSGSWEVSPQQEEAMKETFRGLWIMGLGELQNYVKSLN